MESFLTFVGFIACAVAIAFIVIKTIETIWFFKEFRKETTKSLENIEETLRKLKP